MEYNRNSDLAFNPEKFLEADAKKSAAACRPRFNFLRQFIVLTDHYKAKLYARLEKEHPDDFYPGMDLLKKPVPLDELEGFLKACFAEDRLDLSDDVFGMLYLDFINGLPGRYPPKLERSDEQTA